jgi:hypothetical protein
LLRKEVAEAPVLDVLGEPVDRLVVLDDLVDLGVVRMNQRGRAYWMSGSLSLRQQNG